MSFDNYYPNRKDKRKPYYDSREFDKTCRNNGSCDFCKNKRTHKNNKRLLSADEQIEEFWYNDFGKYITDY